MCIYALYIYNVSMLYIYVYIYSICCPHYLQSFIAKLPTFSRLPSLPQAGKIQGRLAARIEGGPIHFRMVGSFI